LENGTASPNPPMGENQCAFQPAAVKYNWVSTSIHCCAHCTPNTHFDDLGANSAAVPGFSPITSLLSTVYSLQNRLSPGWRRRVPRHRAQDAVVGSRETGESVPGTPGALGDAPDTAIATKSLKGKFYFGPKKSDAVSYTGSIKLPVWPGYLQCACARDRDRNIVVNATVNAKGVGTAVSNANVMKSLKIS